MRLCRAELRRADNHSPRQKIEEIFLACNILGIRGQVSIEFSVGPKGARRNYIYIPPQNWQGDDIWPFLESKKDQLKPFWDGLEENARRRYETIQKLIEIFNEKTVPKFNAGYENLKALQLEPLSWEDVERVTKKGQVNRVHLGLVVYRAMRPIALKRALYLKNQYHMYPPKSAEAEQYYSRYLEAQRAYEELKPTLCGSKYIVPECDYDRHFRTNRRSCPYSTIAADIR